MIQEIKSTSQANLLRPSEVAMIKCGKKHIPTVGISDDAASVREKWNV